MEPLPWKWALFVWVYALSWALVTDQVKLLGYRILDYTNAQATSEARATRKTEGKTKANSDTKNDAKPDAKAAPKPEAKAEANPDGKAEPKPEAKAEDSSDLTPRIAAGLRSLRAASPWSKPSGSRLALGGARDSGKADSQVVRESSCKPSRIKRTYGPRI